MSHVQTHGRWTLRGISSSPDPVEVYELLFQTWHRVFGRGGVGFFQSALSAFMSASICLSLHAEGITLQTSGARYIVIFAELLLLWGRSIHKLLCGGVTDMYILNETSLWHLFKKTLGSYEMMIIPLGLWAAQMFATFGAGDPKTHKNSSMELTVIWGNSDFAHSDFDHSDFAHFVLSKILTSSLNIHNLGTHLAHMQMEQI